MKEKGRKVVGGAQRFKDKADMDALTDLVNNTREEAKKAFLERITDMLNSGEIDNAVLVGVKGGRVDTIAVMLMDEGAPSHVTGYLEDGKFFWQTQNYLDTGE